MLILPQYGSLLEVHTGHDMYYRSTAQRKNRLKRPTVTNIETERLALINLLTSLLHSPID